MTSRDIINQLIRNKKADRIGFNDGIWNDTMKEWVKQGYPVDENNKPLAPSKYLNFDMVDTGDAFDWKPILGYKEVLEETEEWCIIKDGAGASLKLWKDKDGTPEHIAFEMDSREVWEQKYRPHLLEPDERRINVKMHKERMEEARAQGKWVSCCSLGLWEFMRASMGDINMLEALLLDPDWILDFNRVYTDFYKAHYKMFFEKVGIPDGVWLYDDLAYKNGPFCSPEILRELFFPFYKEIADFFHSYDLPVVFHSCGYMESVLPMIVEAGYDALNPMERKAGCDPLKFARKYKDKLTFIGGFDATIWEDGDKEAILAESKRLIDGMKEIGAAYIFGSDHSVSPAVSYESFRTSMDYYMENRDYH